MNDVMTPERSLLGILRVTSFIFTKVNRPPLELFVPTNYIKISLQLKESQKNAGNYSFS